MNSLALLTDASLHSELKRLVGTSNALTAQLLAHLGEVEARGIHRERACSSLYIYCVYELRMSEDEAQRRCRAARLARQFPILLEMLAEASLHLTGLLLIGPHLTDENCAELLARARFRTKREIERLVAEIAPCHDVPSRIVPLSRAGADDWRVSRLDDSPRPRNTWAAYVQGLAGDVRRLEGGLGAGQAPPLASDDETAAAATEQTTSDAAQDGDTGARTPASDEKQDGETGAHTPTLDDGNDVSASPLDERLGVSTPAAPSDARPRCASGASHPIAPVPPVELRYKVQFTADQAYVELLEEARNLLQHELPTRDLVAVQRRALELLVRQLRQRKYAANERPRAKTAAPVNRTQRQQPKSARPPEPQSATDVRQSTLQSATDAAPAAPSSATRTRYSTPQSETGARRAATQALHPTTDARHSAPQSADHSRYISAKVRRSVWKRDEARCAYVDTRGQRCREQAGLQFHHQHPHARGGPPSIDNIALRCRSHNDLAAEQDFGRAVIREKQRARRATLPKTTRAGAAP